MKNYYQILGLEKNASKDEIKKAFRLYATKYHPDKQSGDKFFEERFKEIYSAYETLSDDIKRRQYDISFSRSSTENKSDSNYNDLLEKERELLFKEQELKRKEAEVNSKKYHIEQSERLKKEYELSKIIYYKDFQIIVSGVNLQIDSKKYSFDDYFDVKSQKIDRSKNQSSKKSEFIYGLAVISIMVGLFTLGIAIGVFLIIFGFLLLMVGLFSNVFRFFYVTIKDMICPRYQIILLV